MRFLPARSRAVVGRRVQRIMAGDDQPADASPRRGEQLPGAFQLLAGQPSRDVRLAREGSSPRIAVSRVQEPEPGILRGRSELAEELLEPAVPMRPDRVPVVIPREDRRPCRIVQPGLELPSGRPGTRPAGRWWSGRR